MNDAMLRDSLAHFVDDGPPYEPQVALVLRAGRARRRRRRVTTAMASSVGLTAVAAIIAVAVPALVTSPDAEPTSPALSAPQTAPSVAGRSGLAEGPSVVSAPSSEALTVPAESPASESHGKPDPQTAFDEAAKNAILSGVAAVSPPEWKLELAANISPSGEVNPSEWKSREAAGMSRSARGWDGWSIAGSADDGRGKSLLRVTVGVGMRTYSEKKNAEASPPLPPLPPAGTCLPSSEAGMTCVLTPQPDGRILMVTRHVSPEPKPGRINIWVTLVDVGGDVSITADSGNFAHEPIRPPGMKRAEPTRSDPLYSAELLTELVLAVDRQVQPHLRSVKAAGP